MLYYNTFIFLGLALANGGRHDWAYDVASLLLVGNLIPLTIALVRTRARRYRLGPGFWLLSIVLPWLVFDVLFIRALFNPSHATIYNNLFSPLLPLAHASGWPTTPNPERSRLFLQFLIGLQIMTLQLAYNPVSRRQLKHCLGLILCTGASLAIIGGLMKLTGSQKFLWIWEFREPAAYATFFYKNHYAYFALLSAGCGMALFHRVYQRERLSGHLPEKSIGIASLVGVLLISIPLAEARGASLVAIPLALGFLYSLFQVTSPKKRRSALPGTLLLAALCIWGVTQITAPQIERSVDRSEREIIFYKETGPGRNHRLAAYRDSLAMLREKPVWGWGIGSFIHIHPIYAGEEFYEKGAAHPIAYEFTHSDYLQALTEIGYVGSLLFFTPFGFLLIVLYKKANWQKSTSLWLLGASAAVATTAVFDFTLSSPAIACGCLLLAATSIAGSKDCYA